MRNWLETIQSNFTFLSNQISLIFCPSSDGKAQRQSIVILPRGCQMLLYSETFTISHHSPLKQSQDKILRRHVICIETKPIKPSHCYARVKLENNRCCYSTAIHTSTARI